MMAKTGKMKEINVDWDAVDEALKKVSDLPEGAITRRMIEEHYGVGKTAALSRMDALAKSGKFVKQKGIVDGQALCYLLPA